MRFSTYIFLLFIMSFTSLKGQNQYLKYGEVNELIENGDLKLEEGDYYGAIYFYELAYTMDSVAEGLNFKLGYAYKGYHNYKKAIPFFNTIDTSTILKEMHPTYLFHLADIYKRQGDYKKSEKLFKQFVLKNRNTPSFEVTWAKNELKQFNQVYELLKDTLDVEIQNLGMEVNSSEAEFNSRFTSDTTFEFSTLRASVITEEGIVKGADDYYITIAKAKLKDSVWVEEGSLAPYRNNSISNGSYDDLNNEYYFSKWNKEQVEVFSAKLKEGKIDWGTVEKVDFNLAGFSTKNPQVIQQGSKKFVVFTSDRPGGKGGWDLWYSEFKRGKWSRAKNLGNAVNSKGDEVAPFYDEKSKAIYFSSNWHYNLGGFDIYKGLGNWKRPTSIKNLGYPMNSTENDLYFSPLDSLKGMFTSARPGSISSGESVCCNDLFSYSFPVPEIIKDSLEIPKDELTLLRLQKLIEEYHVTLYFHNDRPNPDNWDTITPFTYMETYNDYIERIPTYRSEYSKRLNGEDSLLAVDEIQDFFDDYVHRGVSDLKIFTAEILKELDAGNKIELTVKGYASPLAKSDYNVNLTLRRINSLQNYLRRYPSNPFSKYLDNKASNGGFLKITKVPFGEVRSDSTVSDNFYDTRNSVYSKGAALERKIEIINIQLINDSTRDELGSVFNLDSLITTIDLGKRDSTVFEWRFHLKNTSDSLIEIDSISTGCTCVAPKRKKWQIKPNEVEPLDLDFNMEGYSGKVGRKVEIFYKNGESRTLLILFEL